MDSLALRLLKQHEGFRGKPYRDTVGKLTIGYGRNLDDRGIIEPEGVYLLDNDIAEVTVELERRLPLFRTIDSVRQAVLIDMAVNMGVAGLLAFKKTIRFLETGWYGAASDEMLHSKWAEQVGDRAIHLARLVRDGVEA